MASGRAQELNDRGRELADKGWCAEAESAYRAAAAEAPDWSVPWYNLALMQKYRGEWAASMENNLRAAELDPSDEASWWNLGIAATALGDWEQARRAWNACGISAPQGTGPIEMKLGLVPIRLTAGSEGEVVWCDRIDPARAVILNIPLPESGHRWRDLLLHDGAANGYRNLRGKDVPVFDELACLQPSGFETFVIQVSADHEAIEALSSVADSMGGAAEDWSTNIRILCKACSEGTPGHLHDVAHAAPAHPHVGLAARDEAHAQEILTAWTRQCANAAVHAFVPPSRKADDASAGV